MENADGFYRLIWPHAPMLLRVAQLLCRNPSDADDLVQETLLKGYRHLDQFTKGNDAKNWLLTILRNTQTDSVRSRAARRDSVSLDSVGAEPAAPQLRPAEPCWRDPLALLESLGDQQLITALLELPDDIRWTLLLVDVEGLEMKDAAGIMDIPAGTVKSRLHRGRGMLREKLLPLLASRGGNPIPGEQ